MIIGLGLIVFDQFETIEGLISGTQTLSILDVPIDPTTGGILGTIILGAPDVIPFEQAGTMIGVPFTSTLFPNSPCSDNLTDGNMFPRLPPDFGRRLSGEKNQLDPVWWGSRDTGITDSRDCAFAYAQFDIEPIPNDFVATSVALKLEILETRGIRNTNNPSQQCLITLQDFNLDTIADAGVISKLYEGLVVASGTWCNSLGVRTFQFSQSAVNLVNDAISGGAFDQGVRSDKLLLGFVPKLFDNLGTGKNRISTEFWKTQGSLFITGSSPPINCGIGFNQVDFRCIPIVCELTETLNVTSNQCETIQCGANETLEIILAEPIDCLAVCIDDPSTPDIIECGTCNIPEDRAVCTPIPITSCPEGQYLEGNGCIDLVCSIGFEVIGNQCVLKTCGIGLELNQDTCQAIVCPTNTILSGNDCFPLTCPTGHNIIDNECVSVTEGLCVRDGEIFPLSFFPPECPLVECEAGFKAVGNICLPIQLDCPEGTIEQENVCVQFLPDLMISQVPELGFITILGIVTFAGSFFGLVGTSVRKQ